MTSLRASPQRVLVVGSGRRIQNNFLPALSRMPDRAQATALWSRTAGHAEAVGATWSVPVARSIGACLADVDTVIISVSTKAVHTVLEHLSPRADALNLVIDTPVFGSARHLPAMRLLRRFAKVIVAEDYAHFPQWALARRAVAAGLIGQVRSIELRHSGFRYHGLALIRSFLGWPFAHRMKKVSSNGAATMEFYFDHGCVGRIVEPYDQDRGVTVISGTSGTITFRSSGYGQPSARDEQDHIIEPLGPDGMPEGFVLGDHFEPLPELVPLLSLPTPDRSVFNALQTCGLLTVLTELGNPAPPTYDYRQALYDHLTTAWLRNAPGALDPAAALHVNFVNALDRAMALLPVTTHKPLEIAGEHP
jgi:Oxidoreductase family, NAD-binding Rossmann fold